jgi:hypothetical protein
MERFLQVADECDDAIAACRHWLLGSATSMAVSPALAAAVVAGALAAAWFAAGI